MKKRREDSGKKKNETEIGGKQERLERDIRTGGKWK